MEPGGRIRVTEVQERYTSSSCRWPSKMVSCSRDISEDRIEGAVSDEREASARHQPREQSPIYVINPPKKQEEGYLH